MTTCPSATYLARFGGEDAREAMDLAVEIGLRTTAARHRGKVTIETLRECLHWVRGKAAQGPRDGFGNNQGDAPFVTTTPFFFLIHIFIF